MQNYVKGRRSKSKPFFYVEKQVVSSTVLFISFVVSVLASISISISIVIVPFFCVEQPPWLVVLNMVGPFLLRYQHVVNSPAASLEIDYYQVLLLTKS